MLLPLRQYQTNAFDNTRREFASGHDSVLLVGPTGSGKTVTSSHLIAAATAKGNETFFLTHRREILYQTAEKLKAAGIQYNWMLAGHKQTNVHNVYLGSIQTLMRRDFPKVKFLIIDEGHHAVAKSYQDAIAKFRSLHEGVRVLGLTATPCRADGRGLGNVFDSMVVSASVAQLIEQGYLVPPTIYSAEVPSPEDLRIRMRDYDMEDAAALYDNPKLVGDILEIWVVYVAGRPLHQQRTIAFCTNVAHSIHLCEAFNHAGIKAEHIDGETPKPERKRILQRHRSGDTTVLTNCGVLTEGYDDPGVHAVVLARPTKSFGLYLQMAGRGLRPDPASGKRELILLDHGDLWGEHGSPEDPVAWSLEEDRPAATRPKKETTEALERQWRCDVCMHINHGGRTCDRCGSTRSRAAKTPVVALGKLTQVKRGARTRTQDKERFWEKCIWIAINKGQKIGAAVHMYKEEFGVTPFKQKFKEMPKTKEEWSMKAFDFHQLHRERERAN